MGGGGAASGADPWLWGSSHAAARASETRLARRNGDAPGGKIRSGIPAHANAFVGPWAPSLAQYALDPVRFIQTRPHARCRPQVRHSRPRGSDHRGQVPRAAPHRHGRHGNGVGGRAHHAQHARHHQVHQAAVRQSARGARPLRDRGPRRREAEDQARLPRLRLRRQPRRAALHRHGVPGGRVALGRHHRPRTSSRPRGGADHRRERWPRRTRRASSIATSSRTTSSSRGATSRSRACRTWSSWSTSASRRSSRSRPSPARSDAPWAARRARAPSSARRTSWRPSSCAARSSWSRPTRTRTS